MSICRKKLIKRLDYTNIQMIIQIENFIVKRTCDRGINRHSAVIYYPFVSYVLLRLKNFAVFLSKINFTGYSLALEIYIIEI